MYQLKIVSILAIAALLLSGCSGASDSTSSSPPTGPATSSPFPPPSGAVAFTGSGATFPKPLIETWALEYAKKQRSVQVSYGGGGSGKGISDITAKNVLFAGSDAPLGTTEKANAEKDGGTLLQFPETLGVVAAAYNLGSVDCLRLDGETLGRIFTGHVKRWNDPAIKAVNEGSCASKLPDAAISIVYRSDSSGTTFVFTDYLAKASPTWASTMGASASKKPDWTKSTASQQAGNGNDGVGSAVRSTPNSIGYVELAFVKSLGLKAAAMQSKDGAFVAPSTGGAAAAASSFAGTLPRPEGDWSGVSIVNAPGADAYPISSFSYILVYQEQADYGGRVSADQMQAFKAWMWWCLHDGQSYSEQLGYAPLPSDIAQIGSDALGTIA